MGQAQLRLRRRRSLPARVSVRCLFSCGRRVTGVMIDLKPPELSTCRRHEARFAALCRSRASSVSPVRTVPTCRGVRCGVAAGTGQRRRAAGGGCRCLPHGSYQRRTCSRPPDRPPVARHLRANSPPSSGRRGVRLMSPSLIDDTETREDRSTMRWAVGLRCQRGRSNRLVRCSAMPTRATQRPRR